MVQKGRIPHVQNVKETRKSKYPPLKLESKTQAKNVVVGRDGRRKISSETYSLSGKF